MSSRLFLPPLLLLLLLAGGCSIRDPKQPPPPPEDPYAVARAMISEGFDSLREGDLVFRTGLEFSSQYIRNFNRDDRTYSHGGVVGFDKGYPYVYHIVAGDENPSSKLRRDSLPRFCNPRTNGGFGIYRFDLDSAELRRLMKEVRLHERDGVRFDSLFNLATNDRMYCSEMIKKSLEAATRGRIVIPTTRPTPNEAKFFAEHLKLQPDYAAALKVVTTDNLFLHPHCRLVKRFDFTSRP